MSRDDFTLPIRRLQAQGLATVASLFRRLRKLLLHKVDDPSDVTPMTSIGRINHLERLREPEI
jgi:hypothetical protein